MNRTPWVSPEIVEQILLIGRSQVPNEACGVITPDSKVLKLPNSSPSPQRAFVITREDLLNALDKWFEESDYPLEGLSRSDFIIWHTHPDGSIGPSKGDMGEVDDGFSHVVISLPNGEATIF